MIGAMRSVGELGIHRNVSLQVIYASSVMMIMGTGVIYPVLPVIAQSLEVPRSQIGLILTVFTLPSIFLAPLIGMLADLKGRKVVLSSCLLLYGVAGLGITFVDSFSSVLVLRALQGVGYAGVMPLTIVLIGDTFTRETETSAQGIKVLLDRAALLVIPIAVGALSALAWQMPFVLYALTIPLAFVAMLRLREPAVAKEERPQNYLKMVGRACLEIRSLTIFSMSSMRFFLEFSFFTYLPIFAIETLGVSVIKGGLLFGVFAFGSMMTASVIGPLAARFERVPLVVGSFLVQAGCLSVAALAQNVWWLGAAMLVFGLSNGIISPAQKSLLTQSVPRQLRAGFVSADRISQQVAKSIAPLFAGFIVVLSSIQTMFMVMGVFTLAWVIVVVALNARGALKPSLVGAAEATPLQRR
jgi:MFS family permease